MREPVSFELDQSTNNKLPSSFVLVRNCTIYHTLFTIRISVYRLIDNHSPLGYKWSDSQSSGFQIQEEQENKMKLSHSISMRAAMLVALIVTLSLVSSSMRAADTPIPGDSGTCNGSNVIIPFTDVGSSIFFCSIAEAYFSGLTFGTKPVQYSPSQPTPRDQMSAFITRTLDQSVKRSIRRTAMRQTWDTQLAGNLGLTALTGSSSTRLVESDGADLWVASNISGTVSRVKASDGALLGMWTGAADAYGVLVAMGKVFVTGGTAPGSLYSIDPALPPTVVTTVASTLPDGPFGISYDGQRIWVAALSGVSYITLNPTVVTNVTAGFTAPVGIIFDGSSIWVADGGDNKLKKLNSDGSIAVSVNVGARPQHPAFDGINIWVPNFDGTSVTVVRATGGLSGTVLATLTGNGLGSPTQAAFDGERILVTNLNSHSVSLWRASDLTAIGSFSTGGGTFPLGASSDGVNFWITLNGSTQLARY